MDSLWLNALNLTFGLARVKKLLKTFGSAQKAWRASNAKVLELDFDGESIREILKRKENVDPQEEWNRLAKENIQTISFYQKEYPPLLKEISSAPLLLYLKGNTDLLPEKSLAVVGTRTPSSYGRLAVDMLVDKLAMAGLVIVSGLAQGIDALAHAATLKAGGKTIAVLGCGLDQIYPKMNEPLAQEIIKNSGLIVSEYPLATPALKQNFPARNRIVGGLALGVLVIESKENGGALITAQQALENNREVFALPGPINQPTCIGTNKLIQDGAKLVMSAEDILQELNIKEMSAAEKIQINLETLPEDEKMIVILIQTEPIHIDKITQTVKLKPHVVSSTLTSLELKGLIKNIGGQMYTIA